MKNLKAITTASDRQGERLVRLFARLKAPWPVLFVVSAGLLLYAHYRAWWYHAGLPLSKLILLINTGLVVWLWYGRPFPV